MRWVVGDVQGCARELDDLLERIQFQRGRDELVSVGDLVNRGPDSAAAVRLWRDVGGTGVIGNHEVYALRVNDGAVARRSDTLDDLFSAPDRDELLVALRALPALLHLPAGEAGAEAWVVHAGLHPLWTDLPAAAAHLNAELHDDAWLASRDLTYATRVRCCSVGGEMIDHKGPPEDAPTGYRAWDSLYGGPSRVAHGHWAWRGHYVGPFTTGLDSGCVYGRKLTAWCVEEDRIEQVPARTR